MNNNSEFMPVECLNVPKVLFYDKQYEDLSMDAKLIYNFNRETAACGAIFMDYRNDVDAKACLLYTSPSPRD